MQLRSFQTPIEQGVYKAWSEGAINVMPVAPTGSGKTVIMAHMLNAYQYPSCAIAHRQELVGQIAIALTRYRVPHRIIAPKKIVSVIIAAEIAECGYTMHHSQAPCAVAGVDTLLNAEGKDFDRWARQVGFVCEDEGHHVLAKNKWGRALAKFANARGMFPTAHALRADGCGLGRHADGLTDQLVLGPPCRDLINQGYLTDYRLICAPSDVNIDGVDINAAGEFNQVKLRAAIHGSNTIVGDVVKTYCQFALGKLGVTFAVDIESARDIAAAYNRAGVPAEVVTAKTPLPLRVSILRRFRNRELLQLVNVDLFGEGFDLPAIEVVSMARHTASFQLYAQQFGRALRLMIAPEILLHWDTYTDEQRLWYIAHSIKPKAIIIDHVNNWERHGLPDKPRSYSLDRRERGAARGLSGADMLTNCLNPECLQPYQRYKTECPYCHHKKIPGGRDRPEMVDGDLFELHPDTLKALRDEKDRIDSAPLVPISQGVPAQLRVRRLHVERQQAQIMLRDGMALWGGYQRHIGLTDAEMQRKFFLSFGVDVATACILNAKDAEALDSKVRGALLVDNVVRAS